MSELETTQEASEQQLQEGQAEEAGQEESQATEQSPVNLDELPQFRNWKSKMDRQLAQERGERERLQQKLEEQQERLQELQLRDAPPDEQVQILKNQLAQTREEQRMEAERRQRAARMRQEAEDVLNSLGVKRDHPDLDWSGGPTEDGVLQLMKSAAKIAAQKDNTSKQQVEAEVRKAKQEAMKETGAADVSTATGSGGPTLRAQYEKELAKLKGSRNIRAFTELRHKYREKGLDV